MNQTPFSALPPKVMPANSPRTERGWLIAAFGFTLLLQLELVFHRPINWDEIYHLSEAHAFARGRFTETLQVFYARAFFWVALLPVDAIDQIRVTRLFMLACELFAAGAIYAMAKRFVNTLPAAIAALAYLTAGYVFQHGFSYRADPIAAALLMGALWTLLTSKLDTKALIGAAILTGLAVLTTIKVVFYLPAFAGIAWLRWKEANVSQEMLLRLAGFGIGALAFSLLFIGLTILTIPDSGSQTAAHTVSTSATMMFHEGLFPRWPDIVGAMATGPFMALLVLATPMEIVRARLPSPQCIALVGLILPLTSIVFYRNSFPYFYVFILPPVMVAAAYASRVVLQIVGPKLLIAILTANAALVSYTTPREVLPVQRQVISAAHEIFPEPVPYFDFSGMIVDFPKANFFMTTWGLKKYRKGLLPTFSDAMEKRAVPLLVLNHEILRRNQIGLEPAWELLDHDAIALRNGFIPHWGPLWVAGRSFPADIQGSEFEIFAPGTYTLEGAGAKIDEKKLAPGQTIILDRGSHRFERLGEGDAALRWGDHLPVPARSFIGGPVFKDF